MTIGERELELDRDSLVALLHDAREHGAAMWIRVKGSSMAPAIPAGATVRLVPMRPEGPRRGDVVLALRASGSPMLHRVLRVLGNRVELKGDNLYRRDHDFDRAALIAIADQVMIDGTPVPMEARPGRSLLTALRQFRRRVGEALGARGPSR